MTELTISNYENALFKHQQFLKKFRNFPQKTRKAIYGQCLQLPLNYSHFTELSKPFPLLPDHSIDNQVSFIVAALSRLYPELGNQWLPAMIYPFVRLFKEDAIACFQICLTFILNWLQPTFTDYPQPAKQVMSFFSSNLKKLQKKVNSLDYPLSAIIQPTLQVLLTDMLNKQQFLTVLDFLLANPYSPEYLLCLCVQIISPLENTLCLQTSIEDISLLLRKQKLIDFPTLFKATIELARKNSEQLESIYAGNMFPVCKGRYPVFEFMSKVHPKYRNVQPDSKMEEVKTKFTKLTTLLNQRLKDDEVGDSCDINSRYREVEGQMRQYLCQINKEHDYKLNVITEIEQKFKAQVGAQEHSRDQQYKRNLLVIEKRAALEREIAVMQAKAHSIREAETAMLRRVEAVAENRKNQLLKKNHQLKFAQKCD